MLDSMLIRAISYGGFHFQRGGPTVFHRNTKYAMAAIRRISVEPMPNMGGAGFVVNQITPGGWRLA
jgi:hypothetical protein